MNRVMRVDDQTSDIHQPETASLGVAQWSFAASLIGLGVLGLIYGDFAINWQRIPIAYLPGRSFFAYACALIELGCGIGLVIRRGTRLATRVLFVYMVLWAVLLKLPAVLFVPQMEATWLGLGEITVILAGAWVLLAAHIRTTGHQRLRFLIGSRGLRLARGLFALSLPTIGLAHFFYVPQTVALMPAWMPWHTFWAYLTGAGSIAASLGLLLGIWPRLAASLEAAMLGVITVIIWGPGLFSTPADRTQWTGFLISAAITCAAWLVANSYRDREQESASTF